MGAGSFLDPTIYIKMLGGGDYNSVKMPDIPDVSTATGAIPEQAMAKTFVEDTGATQRHNITKKRLGTMQAAIPLRTDSVSKGG